MGEAVSEDIDNIINVECRSSLWCPIA